MTGAEVVIVSQDGVPVAALPSGDRAAAWVAADSPQQDEKTTYSIVTLDIDA